MGVPHNDGVQDCVVHDVQLHAAALGGFCKDIWALDAHVCVGQYLTEVLNLGDSS